MSYDVVYELAMKRWSIDHDRLGNPVISRTWRTKHAISGDQREWREILTCEDAAIYFLAAVAEGYIYGNPIFLIALLRSKWWTQQKWRKLSTDKVIQVKQHNFMFYFKCKKIKNIAMVPIYIFYVCVCVCVYIYIYIYIKLSFRCFVGKSVLIKVKHCLRTINNILQLHTLLSSSQLSYLIAISRRKGRSLRLLPRLFRMRI